MSLLVRGGRLIDPARSVDARLDVLIEEERVARIAERIEPPAGAEVLNASGWVVAPGFIDLHVHLREPGQEAKETVATGVAAAVAGGFTAVACMANTSPVNDCRLVTDRIVQSAREAALARVYPIGAVSKGLAGETLAPFGELVAAGCVALSDDGRPVQNAELLRRALEYSQHFDVPVVQHAQDLDLSGDGVIHEGVAAACCGLPGIPAVAEEAMIARDLVLVEETGGRYHVAHLSTARSLELVRGARARGLRVTCEVTPHHLVLSDAAILDSGFDSNFKMNPPLRDARDLEALIAGLADGSVDAIATDHAPHTPDEKSLEIQAAPFGVVGLETAVSICLDRLVRAGRLELPRLVELFTSGPARTFGLPGGSLAEGGVADLTLLDLERRVTVDAAAFRSRSRNTPFGGWSLLGGPAATIVGGRLVWRADA